MLYDQGLLMYVLESFLNVSPFHNKKLLSDSFIFVDFFCS